MGHVFLLTLEINAPIEIIDSKMTKKIKICFVIPTLTQGGAERVVVTLINHLDRERFSVSLMVVNMKDEMYLSEFDQTLMLLT